MIVLYGCGNHSRRILTAFRGLENLFDCFIDQYTESRIFFDKKVYRANWLLNHRDAKVVISVDKEIEGEVRETLSGIVDDANITLIGDWLCELLQDKSGKDVLVSPRQVRLEACSLCQLDCVGCYMRNGRKGDTGDGYLSADEFYNFINKNPLLESVELSNSGEVFLNPDLYEILEIAYENNLIITMSNGVNLNNASERVLEALVKFNVRHISVSIDGASQEIYSKYRRKGNYKNVIHNIETINKYKEKYNSKNPQLSWQFVLMESTEPDVEMAKNEAERLGMRINYKLDWRGGTHQKILSLSDV